jgi:hypothetical protein
MVVVVVVVTTDRRPFAPICQGFRTTDKPRSRPKADRISTLRVFKLSFSRGTPRWLVRNVLPKVIGSREASPLLPTDPAPAPGARAPHPMNGSSESQAQASEVAVTSSLDAVTCGQVTVAPWHCIGTQRIHPYQHTHNVDKRVCEDVDGEDHIISAARRDASHLQ